MKSKPEILNIQNLLNDCRYIIPLYQRNYAWTITENTQLLQDILDKFVEDCNSNYYIGTLVADNRDNNLFEIIDGQQRFTTLSLINAVIIGRSSDKKNSRKPNLDFESRTEIRAFLERLFSDYENAKLFKTEHLGLLNIIQAVKDIENFLCNKIPILKREGFENYFFNQVKIIRVDVPKGTDINHYFEIMNNRGEQLEFHEILKAKFLESIENDNYILNRENVKEQFNIIWTACSQMNKHVQMCVSTEQRKSIFGDNFDRIPQNYIKIHEDSISTKIELDNPENLLINIISNHSITSGFQQIIEQKAANKYESILDFSNFLLQVLKINNSDISLDDKKLLDEFGYTSKIEGRQLPNAVSFVNDLLFYRTLFDRFIIKREEGNDDWRWCILSPKSSNEEIYYVNTNFAESTLSDEPEGSNKIFCMIQSMLHVSFPSRNYKNWLSKVLSFLGHSVNLNDNESFYNCLKEISKNYFIEYSSKGLDNGVSTERFIFNYLDYILWFKYDSEIKGKSITSVNNLYSKIFNSKKLFDNFRYRQNNSVEHLLPQSKKDELYLIENDDNAVFLDKDKILNCFGNLCLISRESNSKYNDYNFEAKKEQFLKKSYIESLKQAIMFSSEKWNTTQIKEHETEMVNLFNEYLDNS